MESQQQMRLIDLYEAPIGDFGTIGDFDDPNQSIPNASDRRAVTAAPMIRRIKQAWEKTPFVFNLFFANIPDGMSYKEQGWASDSTVKRIFPDMADRVLAGQQTGAITVVFTNNHGDEGVSFTPWIIAHRISHSMILPNNSRDPRQGMQNPAFRKANDQVLNLYRDTFVTLTNQLGMSIGGIPEESERSPMRHFFELLGTMRSARSGQMPRPGEFPHEVFAQYMLQGAITFNRIDQQFMTEFGKRAGMKVPARIDPKYLESANEDLTYYERVLVKSYNAGLKVAKGEVIFM